MMMIKCILSVYLLLAILDVSSAGLLSLPGGLYNFLFRVDFINFTRPDIVIDGNPMFADGTPQLFIAYYAIDTCKQLAGSYSTIVNNSNNPAWTNEDLRFLGYVNSESKITCIQFDIYDLNSNSSVGYNLVRRFSLDSRIWGNYFNAIGTQLTWVYVDPLSFISVQYSTKVDFSVDFSKLVDTSNSKRNSEAFGVFLLITLGLSIPISIFDVKYNRANMGLGNWTKLGIVLRSLLWLFLGGLWVGVVYALYGLILMASLVGIPFGMKLLKLSVLIFMPFGRQVVDDQQSAGMLKLSMAANLLWIILGGAILAILHLFCAILMIATIIGIPFGVEQMKLAKVALFPFGKTVVKTDNAGPQFEFDPEELRKRTAGEENGSPNLENGSNRPTL
jgi:uncharacterized membrane protein YccF (DUF307 family)